MRGIEKWAAVLAAALTLFQACEPMQTEKPVESGEVTLFLPGHLDGKMNAAYNTLTWTAADRPLLVRIADDQRFLSETAKNVTLAEDGSVRFSYRFPSAAEEFRYWCCQNGVPTSAEFAKSVKAWPLFIPTVQHPQAQAIDPAADVLVSNLSFSLPQEFFADNELELRLKRLNAVARLKLSGIPRDYRLKEIQLVAPMALNGKRDYNVVEERLSNSYAEEARLTLSFGDDVEVQRDAEGRLIAWASCWPGVIERYQVLAKTVDASGESHEYRAEIKPFTSAVLLESQVVTEWPLEMKDVKDVPVLPETPEGPEGVLHGQQGATLELFKKIKAYADNGISMVEDWWTHQLGYQGVAIHEAKIIQYGAPVHMWILEADPSKVGFALGTPHGSNRVPAPSLQQVSGQAEVALNAGKKVIAAINGDAWGARGGNYTYGVMFKDGECLKNWAVNANDISNTDTFYVLDDGHAGIVDEDDFKALAQVRKVETAIGGWYRLISQGGESYAQSGAKDGDPLLRDRNKTSGSLRDFLDVQPRTFLGVSEDRVYLVVVDGRQKGWSSGLTLNGCARLLYSLGCKRGVNLDGGGSSVMIKRSGNGFKVLDRPSDGAERNVANSLLVVAR